MTKKYIMISMVSVLIMTLGVSLAYFRPKIEGEGNNIVIKTKDIQINYTTDRYITTSNLTNGWTLSKTLTITNNTNETYRYNIAIKGLVNTYVATGELQYQITSTNDGYTSDWKDVPKKNYEDATLAYQVSIPSGTTQNYTFNFRYNTSSAESGKIFSGKLSISKESEKIYTLVEKVLELNPTRLTRTSFNDVLTTTNTGTLYTTTNTEDGSTVYYFAGNALNNWVKFGKCTKSTYNCTVGDDLYWRIIRTNEDIEDGGIRLLYAGSGSVANQNAYIGSNTYNASANDPMYVGYMYGTTGSLAKNRTNQSKLNRNFIMFWSGYSFTFCGYGSQDSNGLYLINYLNESAIYCNDRSIGSGTYNTSSTAFYFGAYTRLYTNKTPSYACGANTSGFGHYFEGSASIADKFTGSTTNSNSQTIGNGLLGSAPAALITADEIVFAGGKYETNVPAWYYYNAASTPGSSTNTQRWCTMSPIHWDGSHANVFTVAGSDYPGLLGYNSTNDSGALRPVISLKANVLWDTGDGSSESPFEVTIGDVTNPVECEVCMSCYGGGN